MNGRPPRSIETSASASSMGSRKPVALDAALVAERFAQRLTERERHVFHRVVLVDLDVAAAFDVELETPVFAELFQHVVEEAETGPRARFRLAIEIDGGRGCRSLSSCE